MNGKMPISLVDFMAFKCGCMYVSDLPHVGMHEKMKIIRVLETLETDIFSIHDWNDALDYLLHEPPCDTEEEAREKLASRLLSECGIRN